MYKAYITYVKNIRPAENSNFLNACEVFGNTTIIDKTITEDMLVLYLPSDGQISMEFGEKNNLFRKKDDAGNNIGGFVDPVKRNITAIRLRGNRSDGLVLPISCLNYCYAHGNASTELHAGDIINGTLNGHEICCKYIPVIKNKTSSKTKKCNKVRKYTAPVAPLFIEHADTEQLNYNLDAFKAGDQIEITLKMHGCFIQGTKVRMADGSLKCIESIRVGDEVLGYDIANKKVVSTKVLHTFKNAPSSKWNQIKISRNGMLGDRRGTQTSTWNHRYWVEEKQQWVMAKDLKVGEKISTLFPSLILTDLQKAVAIGQFLGDGCLMSYNEKTAEIQESKKASNKEYLDYISEITSNWFGGLQEKTSGYGTSIITGRTTRSADLYNYMKDCSTFKNQTNNQRLLQGIIEKVTPLSLAIWYMSDGSLAHSDTQQDRALLAICRYTQVEDQEIIKAIFNKYDICPTFYMDTNNYPRIRFNLNEANKLFELIKGYIPSCMQYKLPKCFQGYFNKPIENENFNSSGYVLSEQEVLENIEINKQFDEYDLETELHNYIVGLSIVHNTSNRVAYVPVLKRFKRTLFDRILGREGKPIYEYDYISGTRRTVLDSFNGGFYGSNVFRKQFEDRLRGKLLKNEEIYFEIVSYTNDGKPIMPSGPVPKDYQNIYGKDMIFSYGCEVGHSEMYVYRMTMTNEDGDVVEYSPDFMRYRCEQIGVKTVPVFYKGYIPEEYTEIKTQLDNHTVKIANYTTPGEWVKDLAEQFYDGPDPIGKTHVREGVVVRIINRPKFCAYKHKNFLFKMVTGIIVENVADSNLEIDQNILEEL